MNTPVLTGGTKLVLLQLHHIRIGPRVDDFLKRLHSAFPLLWYGVPRREGFGFRIVIPVCVATSDVPALMAAAETVSLQFRGMRVQ